MCWRKKTDSTESMYQQGVCIRGLFYHLNQDKEPVSSLKRLLIPTLSHKISSSISAFTEASAGVSLSFAYTTQKRWSQIFNQPVWKYASKGRRFWEMVCFSPELINMKPRGKMNYVTVRGWWGCALWMRDTWIQLFCPHWQSVWGCGRHSVEIQCVCVCVWSACLCICVSGMQWSSLLKVELNLLDGNYNLYSS